MSAIVACCSKAGLAVIRGLGGQGIPIAALCFGPHQMGAASHFVHARYNCPDPGEDEAGFIDALLALERKWDGAVLFPSDDSSLVAIARHYQSLAQRYRLVCHDWSVVSTLIEKHHTYRIAREHDVPCPQLQLVDSLADSLEFAARIGFPCLLKPSVSHLFFKRHHKKMFMVNDEAELRARMSQALGYGGELMLCEYIPGGDEHGANYNSFAIDGEPVREFTASKVRNKPRLIGFPTVVRSEVLPEVRELGRRMLRALKLNDFSCIEFKRDARTNQYKLMEVNGRHNYSGALAIACGMNFPLLSYRRALGQPSPEMPLAQKEGVCWIDEERDTRDVLRAVLKGGAAARAVLAPYRSEKVFAVFRHDDPKPSLQLMKSSLAYVLRSRPAHTRARAVEVKSSDSARHA